MTMTTWLVALAMLAATPEDIETVEVEGVGATENEAEKDAFQRAVRQVVGAYVDSTTIATHEDEVKSMTLEMSKGSVDGYDVISKGKTPEGLVTEKLRVRVRRGVVQARIKKATFGGAIDGKALWATAVTRTSSLKAGTAALEAALRDQRNLVVARIVGPEGPGTWQSRTMKDDSGEFKEQIDFILEAYIDPSKYYAEYGPALVQLMDNLPGARVVDEYWNGSTAIEDKCGGGEKIIAIAIQQDPDENVIKSVFDNIPSGFRSNSKFVRIKYRAYCVTDAYQDVWQKNQGFGKEYGEITLAIVLKNETGAPVWSRRVEVRDASMIRRRNDSLYISPALSSGVLSGGSSLSIPDTQDGSGWPDRISIGFKGRDKFAAGDNTVPTADGELRPMITFDEGQIKEFRSSSVSVEFPK